MMLVAKKFLSKVLIASSPNWRNFQFLLGQAAMLTSRASADRFTDLWDAEVKVYSQWGEDGILDYLCERIKLSKPKILEIGAGNFSECNSKFLAENRNASVFAVDGRKDLVDSIKSTSLQWKNHLYALETWVTPDNVGEIITQASMKLGGLDIVSLDLDGNDYWILERAELESISIVVVEYNPLFGFEKAVSVPRDDGFDRKEKHFSSLYYGASLKAFCYLLNKKNFKFIGTNRVGNNAFFVRQDLSKMVPINPRNDLSVYTDWRIRESRSHEGSLTYLSGAERIKQIAHLDIKDVEFGLSITVKDTCTTP